MIYYFSGTGNSQYVAKQLAKLIGDDMVSINQCLKEGTHRTIDHQQAIVIVAPTYAWRMPNIVEQWIMETSFKGNQDIYFVLTCGGSSGNAAKYARSLSVKKGLGWKGLIDIVVPDNYIVMYETPSEADSKEMMAAAMPLIAAAARHIMEHTAFPEQAISLRAKLQSGMINPLFYSFYVKDKGFHVSNACVSCGKCVARCPLNNVKLCDGLPVWQGNCTHCMACIGGCPVNAINYKKATQNRNRYFIMEE